MLFAFLLHQISDVSYLVNYVNVLSIRIDLHYLLIAHCSKREFGFRIHRLCSVIVGLFLDPRAGRTSGHIMKFSGISQQGMWQFSELDDISWINHHKLVKAG